VVRCEQMDILKTTRPRTLLVMMNATPLAWISSAIR